MHPKTMVSCLLGRSRLFLDSLLASRVTLAPFRLCSCSQLQSSPWDLNSEARASPPSPHPPRQVSTQASPAGECWVGTDLLCRDLSALPCAALLLYSPLWLPIFPPHQPPSLPVKGILMQGNFSFFTAPSQRCISNPYSFVSVCPFFFCPTQVHGEFLAFWEV